MWLLLVCFSLPSPFLSKTRTFDLIEVNHTPNYTQVILWDWSEQYKRFHVQHWYLDENPAVYRVGGVSTIRLQDTRIVAELYRETWTKNDPERENRKLFPEKYRRGLK